MQKVSNAWKSNQAKTLVSESFVEISLGIADPDSLKDASATDNGAIYISNTPQVVSEVDKAVIPYSTLEQNLWVLDGSRKLIPIDKFGDCGYIGDTICDERGLFERTPTVTVGFTKKHTNPIPAVTITWGKAYGEYAEDFIVTAYDGNEISATKKVQNNSDMMSVVRMDIEQYDRIVVEVTRWCLPYRRARIEEIYIGLNKVYTKRDLFSYSHSQTVGPLTTSLPKAEISFAVDNSDNTYDPQNPDGLAKYLMDRQEVKVRYGYKMSDESIEWIKGGNFYLSEWNASQNGSSADFKARDLLEFMSAVYYKGVFNENGVSLYSLAEQLLVEADLPLNDDGSKKWILDESLKNVFTTAPLPIDTIANCLQLIANAGECVFYQDRNGTLHIETLNTAVTDYEITPKNSYSNPEITISKPIKQINVTSYHYFEDSASTELYKGTLNFEGEREIWITYSDRAKNATAVVTGGELKSVDYYTNACRMTIVGHGTVDIVISGTTLKESKTEVITENALIGETITLDNPLVTSQARAESIGRWSIDYLSKRTSLALSWRVDPSIDALDIITSKGEYSPNNVIMTDVTFEYNGTFRGNGEGKVI